MSTPPAHTKFLQPVQAIRIGEPLAVNGDLVLQVRNKPLPETKIWSTPLCRTKIWELWLDEAGRYVFVAPRGSPPRQIIVDHDFKSGEVSGDFSSSNGGGLYPLQSLDIRLFANWLANYGDVILHAAGVAIEGKGYCFAGPSGAGKSTLAASLSTNSATTVLGEDQVILRCIDGRFWIYGTPWHLDPTLCSPCGVPLAKLFFLDRNLGQRIVSLPPADGIARLLQTAFIPYYRPKAVAAILDCLALLAEQVPFYMLGYQLESDIWKLIREA